MLNLRLFKRHPFLSRACALLLTILFAAASDIRVAHAFGELGAECPITNEDPIVVTNGTDSITDPQVGSLRWAVSTASDGGEIIFGDITSNLVNLEGQIRIDKCLRINGETPNGGKVDLINPSRNSRFFFVGSPTFTGTVSLQNLIFGGGIARGMGGGIGGASAGMGGAIFQQGGTLNVYGSRFVGNKAIGGWVGYVGGPGGSGFGGPTASRADKNGGPGGNLGGTGGTAGADDANLLGDGNGGAGSGPADIFGGGGGGAGGDSGWGYGLHGSRGGKGGFGGFGAGGGAGGNGGRAVVNTAKAVIIGMHGGDGGYGGKGGFGGGGGTGGSGGGSAFSGAAGVMDNLTGGSGGVFGGGGFGGGNSGSGTDGGFGKTTPGDCTLCTLALPYYCGIVKHECFPPLIGANGLTSDGGGGAGFGGAIFAMSGKLNLSDVIFEKNMAIGGSSYLWSTPNANENEEFHCNLSLDRCGEGRGGALFIYKNATATASNVTFGDIFTRNEAAHSGRDTISYYDYNGTTVDTAGKRQNKCPGRDDRDVCGQLIVATAPTVHIDTPQTDASVFGAVNIQGWAIDNIFAVGTAINSVNVQVYVDDKWVGTATYGQDRTDVCTEYPGRLGCPNVGFEFTWNSVGVTPGTHVIRVEVTGTGNPAGNPIGSAEVMVVVPLLKPKVQIDTQFDSPVIGVINIDGWAIDNATIAGTAITSVNVDVYPTMGRKIDSASGPATYGSFRPDVCEAYPDRPDCPNVGFHYELDTSKLGGGASYRVIVFATNSNTPAIVGYQETTIRVAASPRVVIESPRYNSKVTGIIEISGWAIDGPEIIGTAIDRVEILVDRELVGTAIYGSSRPEVCEIYPGRTGCPDVGFNYTFDTSELAEGPHTIWVKTYSADGRGGIAAWYGTVVNDTSPPILTGPTITGDPGENGWYTGDVTVIWAVSDPESDIESSEGCGPIVLSASSGPLVCSSINGVGLESSSAPVSVYIDKTAPAIADPAIVGAMGTNGWYTSDVTINWAVSDSESGIQSSEGCGPVILSASAGSLVCSARNSAGLESNSAQLSVNLDKTLPLIVAAATTEPNASGWYKSDVTVHFTCTDTLSGIPADTCPPDQRLSEQGTAVASIAKTVTDVAGNTSEPSNVVTIKIDSIAPDFGACSNESFPYDSGEHSVDISATDFISGVNTEASTLISSIFADAALGIVSATFEVEDNAGNIRATSCDYEIISMIDVHSGVLSYLQGLTLPHNKANSKKLNSAIKHLKNSMDSKYWNPDGLNLNKNGQKVFEEGKKTLHDLEKLKPSPPGMEEQVTSLVANYRALAMNAINNSVNKPRNIEKALKLISKGDAQRSVEKAIDNYKTAWQIVTINNDKLH